MMGVSQIMYFACLTGILEVFATFQKPLVSPSVDPGSGPSISNAITNAPQIFNTIYGAMRQWSSSLKHNGMTFFPVTIPENTILYHGSISNETIKGLEWLAFEVEHGELFTGVVPSVLGGPNTNFNLEETIHIENENLTGYLSTYQITRPLTNILYLDGLSSGKSTMGTLDTQDRVLLKDSKFKEIPGFQDLHRAMSLCDLSPNLEGFVRMELGFEIILCESSKGTQLISMTSRTAKWQHKRDRMDSFWMGEFARGVSLGYSGVEAGKVLIDYSSMVSAYFYPLNLTNANVEMKSLPRIPSEDLEGVEKLRSDILGKFDGRERVQGKIDWQSITDSIVSRYSERLAFMRSIKSSRMEMLLETNFLLERFIDHTTQNLTAAHELCKSEYVLRVKPRPSGFTEEMIYEAITAVSGKICDVLLKARKELMEREDQNVAHDVKIMIQELMNWLDWSTWLECGKCDSNEVCVVAIWPWGTKEDHDNPRCIDLYESWGRAGYWDLDYEIPKSPSLVRNEKNY